MLTQINAPQEPLCTTVEWKTLEQRKEIYIRNKAIYYLKQKLVGSLVIALGVVTPFIDGDITALLIFALPLGLYLIFTKQRVMTF